MRVLTIVLCFICSFAYAQECDVSKVDEEGCLVDEKSFTNLVDRLCEVEKNAGIEYAFGCDPDGLVWKDSNGNSDVVDLSCHINEVVEDNQELTYNPENKRLTIEDGNFVDLDVMPTWTTLTAPVLVGAGTFTSNLSQTLETDTRWYTQRDGDCREHYRFTFSIRGDHAAGTGWGYVDVPQPAGWDRDIYYVGTYNYSGNPNNPDDVNRGAMPDTPFMGQNVHNYRNGARVYIGQLNDRDNLSRYWLDIKSNFLRN